MSWTNTPYCALADVKTAMGLLTPGVDDPWISDTLIPQAQSAIDDYLGFSFQQDGTPSVPARRVYDGNGLDQIMIDRCVQVIQVQTQTYTYATDPITGMILRSALSPQDITQDVLLLPNNRPAGFLLERQSRDEFPVGRQNIIVNGVFGFPAPVPADVTRACTRLAIHYFKQRDANYQDQVGDVQHGRQTFRQEMPADVCQLLSKYVRRVFRSH